MQVKIVNRSKVQNQKFNLNHHNQKVKKNKKVKKIFQTIK